MELKKSTRRNLTIIGAILFLLGTYALVLSIVSIQVSFLTWLDNWGGLVGLILRLVMIITGLILAVIASGNFSGED